MAKRDNRSDAPVMCPADYSLSLAADCGFEKQHVVRGSLDTTPPSEILQGSQIKVEKMGEICSARRRDEKCIHFSGPNSREKKTSCEIKA